MGVLKEGDLSKTQERAKIPLGLTGSLFQYTHMHVKLESHPPEASHLLPGSCLVLHLPRIKQHQTPQQRKI